MVKKNSDWKDRRAKMKKRQKTESDTVTRKGGGGFIDTSDHGEVEFFKAEKDKRYTLAIVPFPVNGKLPDSAYSSEGESFDKGDLWYKLQVYVHKGIGVNNRTVMCLAKTLGQKCPICDYAKKLPDDEAKDFRPAVNPMVYYNVVDANDKKKKVMLFSANQYFFEAEIWKEAKAEGVEDITDVAIRFRASEGSFEGRKFLEYKNFVIEQWEGPEAYIDQAFPLDDMLKIPTYDAIKGIFDAVETSDDEEAETPRKGRKPQKEEPEDNDNDDDENGDETEDNDNDDDESGDEPEDKEEYTVEELQEMEEDELRDLAKEEGVVLKRKDSKEEIVKKLCDYFDLEMPEPEPEEKPKRGRKPKEEKKETKSGKCPFGHIFGKDCNDEDDCQKCDESVFEKCLEENEAMTTSKKKK